METQTYINKVYMSQNVILSMLKNRGYQGAFHKLTRSFRELQSLLMVDGDDGDGGDIVGIRDLDDKPVHIHYLRIGSGKKPKDVIERFLKNWIDEYETTLDEEKIDEIFQDLELDGNDEDALKKKVERLTKFVHLVVIYDGEYKTVRSPMGDKMYRYEPRTKLEKTIQSLSNRIEIFELSRTVYDIMENNLVPKHTLLQGDEYKKVVDKYGTTKLSKMLTTDPIVRYYNAKVGDIFRIERNSDETTEIVYRIVV